MSKEIDEFIESANRWKAELKYLRSIALECGLSEAFKWRQPCYTHNNKNILIISSFKKHAFISFLKGALLSDPNSVLIAPGENSNSVRLLPFSDVSEIKSLEKTIKAYIFEALEVENLGLKIKKVAVSEFEIPDELDAKFNQYSEFKKAFEALTPGRQKGYLLHFSSAKKSTTRIARIEKYKSRIMAGYGINDCVCGHSKRMPNCDGAHKQYT